MYFFYKQAYTLVFLYIYLYLPVILHIYYLPTYKPSYFPSHISTVRFLNIYLRTYLCNCPSHISIHVNIHTCRHAYIHTWCKHADLEKNVCTLQQSNAKCLHHHSVFSSFQFALFLFYSFIYLFGFLLTLTFELLFIINLSRFSSLTSVLSTQNVDLHLCPQTSISYSYIHTSFLLSVCYNGPLHN